MSKINGGCRGWRLSTPTTELIERNCCGGCPHGGGHCGCGCCCMASTPAAACSKEAGLKAHRPRRCLPYAAGSFKAHRRQLKTRVTRTRNAARASRTTRSAAGARSLSCTSTPATPPTRSALVSTRMATRIRPGNASRARPTLLVRTTKRHTHSFELTCACRPATAPTWLRDTLLLAVN